LTALPPDRTDREYPAHLTDGVLNMRVLWALALVTLCSTANAATVDGGANPGSYLVYVTNEGSGDVSVVDPVAMTELKRISIGKRPRGLVASPDGKTLYVAVSGSPVAGPGVDESKLPPPDKAADGIMVIDLATLKIVRTLRGISDPEQIAISPDGSRLYVASEDSGRLITMDLTGKILQTLAVGGQPEGIRVSPDGLTMLATSEEDNTVAVLTKPSAATSFSESRRVGVGLRPRNAAFLSTTRAVVPGEFDASLSVLDIAAGTRKIITLSKSDRPMGVVRLDSHTILASTGRGGRVVRVDVDAAPADVITGAVAVGARPWGLALTADHARAFTANGPSDDIAAIDPKTMAVIGRVKVGTGPWGVIVIGSPPK
jgi:YVTN family beta-propeller protein